MIYDLFQKNVSTYYRNEISIYGPKATSSVYDLILYVRWVAHSQKGEGCLKAVFTEGIIYNTTTLSNI
jgi:hypothetical protein